MDVHVSKNKLEEGPGKDEPDKMLNTGENGHERLREARDLGHGEVNSEQRAAYEKDKDRGGGGGRRSHTDREGISVGEEVHHQSSH